MISYGGARSPEIAIKSDGNPCLTWTSNGDIYLRCWDGQGWQELGGSASGGGISNDAGGSLFAAIAIDQNDTIYVAWANQELNNDRVYIKAWNGAAWEELGTGSSTGIGISEINGASAPDLAIAPNGILYVVWGHRYHGPIYGKQWDGTNWSDIGEGSSTAQGISGMNGHAAWPRIEADNSGKLYMVWIQEGADQSGTYAKGFDGTKWHWLGDGVQNSQPQSHLTDDTQQMTFMQSPFVAWTTDEKVLVRQWERNHWIDVNGPVNGNLLSRLIFNRYVQGTRMAIDSNDRPYITWQSALKGESYDIYIRYWDGRDWIDVGHNSASKGGVSDSDGTKPGGHSWIPSIAIDSSDKLYLAWEDQRNGIAEIFVRKWTGEEWIPVGNDGDAGKVEK